MSDLSNRINQDIKAAMLAKDSAKLSALRMLKSAVTNLAISKKIEHPPDAEILDLIRKQIKQRLDAAEQFRKGSRPELAEAEESQIRIYETYLPAQISEEELRGTLERIVRDNQLATKKDFGKAMKLAQGDLSGRAENRRISAVLNELLGS